MNYRNVARSNQEEGFTLIEILVVVLIIGIPAAIAIPVFLNQRQKANDAAVESAVHNATVAVETYFTNNPKAVNVNIDEIKKYFKKDEEVRLTFTGTPEAYCIEGDHRNGGRYVANAEWNSLLVYSSTEGKLSVGSSSGKKCEQVNGGKWANHSAWYYGA